MLQSISVKALAYRVLQEMAARGTSPKVCPTLNTPVGQDAGEQTGAPSVTVPPPKVPDPRAPSERNQTGQQPVSRERVTDSELRHRMEESERRFGQPDARTARSQQGPSPAPAIAKPQAERREIAPCGDPACAGCYDVGDGKKIHPPKCGQ